jgi:hypothetical protein
MWSDADIDILNTALHLARAADYRPTFFFTAYSDESFLVGTSEGPYLMVDTFKETVRHATQSEYEQYMK